MYEKLLVPVDESSVEMALLPHACEVALRFDAEVRLLHVADTARDSVTVTDDGLVDALEAAGRDVVDAAGEVLDTFGVEYTTDVVQGSPADTIAQYATEFNYDCIAMATHGRTGVARGLLGSVTEKVVRLADVPVLTLRGGDHDPLTFPYERILVATDGSATADRAASHAFRLAETLDASVHVVTVIDTAELGPDVRSVLDTSGARAAARETVDAVAEDAPDGVEVTTAVVDGKPSTALGDYVEENGMDAVVLGTTGRRGVDRILLGSVAEQTVRTASVPVITVGGE
ncbi:universal stress protein [Halosegnis longus]|uniref:Universal stress protein n=1 Tax=Halosegnis longus TaxID=2216012 RepID=A0AAJ4UV82_9EURY|nr:universal stress protein [Salella cibi]